MKLYNLGNAPKMLLLTACVLATFIFLGHPFLIRNFTYYEKLSVPRQEITSLSISTSKKYSCNLKLQYIFIKKDKEYYDFKYYQMDILRSEKSNIYSFIEKKYVDESNFLKKLRINTLGLSSSDNSAIRNNFLKEISKNESLLTYEKILTQCASEKRVIR